ncbi:hypothetical protein V5799_027228 [Amblyomma americanum]|uniref:Uncharacterized protein n=1 Tax=Amblyomma americanum TaxID=6943 RepID=A0AAQ4DGB7_AMBAM
MNAAARPAGSTLLREGEKGELGVSDSLSTNWPTIKQTMVHPPLYPIGPRLIQLFKAWSGSAAVYGATGAVAITYFTERNRQLIG